MRTEIEIIQDIERVKQEIEELNLELLKARSLTCKNCAYNGTPCKVMKVKQKNCFAWADEQEKNRREKAIKDYHDNFYGNRRG